MAGGTKFKKLATNEAWKGIDGWHGEVKTLVVIYQYFDIPIMSIVRETETMQYHLPFSSLVQHNGLESVTQESYKTAQCMHNCRPV